MAEPAGPNVKTFTLPLSFVQSNDPINATDFDSEFGEYGVTYEEFVAIGLGDCIELVHTGAVAQQGTERLTVVAVRDIYDGHGIMCMRAAADVLVDSPQMLSLAFVSLSDPITERQLLRRSMTVDVEGKTYRILRNAVGVGEIPPEEFEEYAGGITFEEFRNIRLGDTLIIADSDADEEQNTVRIVGESTFMERRTLSGLVLTGEEALRCFVAIVFEANYTAVEIAANSLQMVGGPVYGADIVNGSIVDAKIQRNSITGSAIGTAAINTRNIATRAVGNSQLAPSAVTRDKCANGLLPSTYPITLPTDESFYSDDGMSTDVFYEELGIDEDMYNDIKAGDMFEIEQDNIMHTSVISGVAKFDDDDVPQLVQFQAANSLFMFVHPTGTDTIIAKRIQIS